MAYLDLREPFAAAGPVAMPAGITRAVSSVQAASAGDDRAATLARTEWQVVLLAQKDGLASLTEPGRFAKLMARLFGGSASRRLADPRLEALRRLAVQAWHHSYALPASAIRQFLASGWTEAQLDLVLAGIAAGRGASRRRSANQL